MSRVDPDEQAFGPPETISIRFCIVCGRNDRYTPFTGKSHMRYGGMCPGQPVEIDYVLADVSKYSLKMERDD